MSYPRRGEFNAYSQNNRPPPANYLPPTDLPEFSNGGLARLNREQLQRTYSARQLAEFERQQHQRIAEAIREQEARSSFGIRQINPDEWDDDEDAIPMARVSSILDPPDPASSASPQIIYVQVPKKKKHKKEKKHKKKHKRSSSTSSDEADEEGTSSSAAKRGRFEDSPTIEKYKLLRKGDWKYTVAHLSCETKPDLENKKYEKASKSEVPEYKRQSREAANTNHAIVEHRAIAERFPTMLKDSEQLAIDKERLFSKKNMRNWETDPERTFRQKLADEFESEDTIKISHQMHDGIDGGASKLKFEPDDDVFNKMDAEDYEHFVKSQETSFQEALAGNNIKAQYSVLHNKITMDKTDAKAWMEFIEIQRHHFANEESGYPDAVIQNKRAYYERVMDIIKKAIAANPANADLQIKKILLMQEHIGVNSPEIKQEWTRLENRFINSIEMWEGDLKMRINDRSTFKLAQTIEKIDHCIAKLVNLKYGNIKSHPYMDGTDEFLVTLLVTRCRLLIVAGHLAKAVGMLQALAEFHFFRPEHLNNPRWPKSYQWNKAKEEFKMFWESGTQRIGEYDAQGWKNKDEDEDIKDEDDWKERQNQWKGIELENLDASLEKLHLAEDQEVNKYKDEGFSIMEARCRFEQFRTKYIWEPIKFQHDSEELDIFKSRLVKFCDIEPVLFPLENDALIQDLVFKLFHLFGIPIPGLKFHSQEDTLREFSSELFESSRPNSMDLEGFQDFFQHFIQLLAESNHMDSARIYAALTTKISHSSMPEKEKIKQLKALATNSCAGHLKRSVVFAGENRCLTQECQFSILIFAFDELNKLKRKADYKAMLNIREYLFLNLDDKNTSLWDIGIKDADGNPITDPVEKKVKNRERLFYMRFILFILRNLPFSDEEGASTKFNNEKSGNLQLPALKTKQEFLLSLWTNGTVSEIPKTQELQSIERARNRVMAYLKTGAPRDPENLPLRWIGNEAEIGFELAALFSYEFPFVHTVQRYKFFQEEKSPLYNSELAKSLSDSTVLQEIRAYVLKHIIHARQGLEFNPGNLVQFLVEQVKQFPHSITLLKMFIDNSKGGAEQIFLAKYPGNDDISRLIRSCGQIYTQRLRLENNMDEMDDEDKKRIVGSMVKIYTKIAENNSDNLIPDDYIWTELINMLMVGGRTTITLNKITEIFNLGQKVCPWSKKFLFTAAQNRPISERHFMSTMDELILAHGLTKFVIDKEIELYMVQQIA